MLKLFTAFDTLFSLLGVCGSSQTPFFVKSFPKRLSIIQNANYGGDNNKEWDWLSDLVCYGLPKMCSSSPVLSLQQDNCGYGLRMEFQFICNNVVVNFFPLRFCDICEFWALGNSQHNVTFSTCLHRVLIFGKFIIACCNQARVRDKDSTMIMWS